MSGVSDMIEMIPTLVVITVIAVVVFGVSATYYSYDISVRDAEARLLGIAITECLAGEGVLNLDEIDSEKYDEVISYCGMRSSERFYVGVDVFRGQDSKAKSKVETLSEGDSGLLWVRDLFEKTVLTGNVALGWNNENVEKIAKYNPGYFNFEHPVLVVKDGNSFDGEVEVEVLVNYE